MTKGRLPRLHTALLGTLLLVLSRAVAAEPAADAQRWLERVATASQTLNYDGTFVYRHQGRIEAMRIIHRGGPDGGAERMISLTGAPREVIRDKNKVTCIFSDERAVMVDQRRLGNPFSNVLTGDLAGLTRSYKMELRGEGRVAGRAAQRIDILPQDQFRYGYRLWVDREAGLLLRADLMGGRGETIEQVMFTELRFPETVPDDALRAQLNGEGFTWYQEKPDPEQARQAEPQWQPQELPQGFQLVLHDVQQMPGSQTPVEHLLYSDGLATVSVYVEKASADGSFAGRSRIGVVHAYGRVVDGHQVTVVGEVPPATVELIAGSVRPAKGN